MEDVGLAVVLECQLRFRSMSPLANPPVRSAARSVRRSDRVSGDLLGYQVFVELQRIG